MFHHPFSHKTGRHAPRRFFAAVLAAALFFAVPVPAQAAHSLPDSAFTQIPDTDLYASPSVSAAESAFQTSLWLTIPDNIRARLIGDGVKIYLISSQDDAIVSLTLKNSSSSGKKVTFVGLTTHPAYVTLSDGTVARVSDGTIEIQTDLASKGVDRTRLIHEIGHYVDSAAGSASAKDFAISSSSAWKTLFAKNESALLATSAYAAVPDLYSASEGWADAFRLLWTDPAALQAISEDLFLYVYQQSVSLPVSGGDVPVSSLSS